MKIRGFVSALLVIVVMAWAAHAQQQSLHTVTAQNKGCNSVCSVIDVPELNGNPSAILLITPIGNLNPHPIGAYFMYLSKWSVFNLDGVAMSVGAQFKIEYYTGPAADRFLYVVPKGLGVSYIDRVGLNSNPNTQLRVFPVNPPSRSALFDREDYKVAYDATASKWFIANINGSPVPSGAAFNVVSSAGGVVASNSNSNPPPVAIPTPIPSAAPTPTPVPISIAAPLPTPSSPAATPRPTIDPNAPVRSATHDWTLRPDPTPSIPANSDVLLFIHGMDSRAEEANDITQALFELKAHPPSTVPTPSSSQQSPNPQIVAALKRILSKYEGCILERYETQLDMIGRHLDPSLSNLATTSGLQNRDSVLCVAGNNCSRAFRTSTFGMLLAQANHGDPTDFEMKLKSAIPADCFECSKHQEWHTKHVHCTMDCGGNQGVDVLHLERSPGACFEGCKAGVDIARLITDVINDIHSALSTLAVAPAPAQVLGGSTIATNYSTVHFTDCANPSEGCPEECDHPDNFSMGTRTGVVPSDVVSGQQVPLYYEPLIPPALLDSPPPPGTQLNVPAGRNIGMNEGRLRSDLRRAAADADPLQSLRVAANQFASGDIVLGNAFADLSVTGHRSFEKFKAAPPGEVFCLSMSAKVRDGCRTALDRAYRVANFLRTGQRGDTTADKTRKISERKALGWIAVSGEDDSPHRPVNVSSSDYPQYNIDVVVETPNAAGVEKSVTVRTRYVVAQSETAKNLVVISVDLPSSGYAENLDYDRISPLTDLGKPLAVPASDIMVTGKTPLLDFIETFIVRFAETLVNQGYLDPNNFKAVMGGSLGGNMAFRLGRRPGVPWLPKFVVWSPASIWNSLGLSPDPLARLGVRKAWEGANKARNSPGPGDRAAFFSSWDKPIVEVIIPMAQSDTWTSDYYPCKKSSVAAARLERHETYDPLFLAWHWRLGAEQLIYSHQTTDPTTNKPRYMSNVKPVLLGCGLGDHVAFNDICPATMNTAPRMTSTPGKAIFMDKTGHSLDNERRSFWAREVFNFLGL